MCKETKPVEFKIGDRVRLVDTDRLTYYDGDECIVTGNTGTIDGWLTVLFVGKDRQFPEDKEPRRYRATRFIPFTSNPEGKDISSDGSSVEQENNGTATQTSTSTSPTPISTLEDILTLQLTRAQRDGAIQMFSHLLERVYEDLSKSIIETGQTAYVKREDQLGVIDLFVELLSIFKQED